MSEQIRSLASKLAEVMKEIDHVEKRGFNSSQNYKFMRAADLAHEVRDKLAGRNIIVLATDIEPRFYQIQTKSGSTLQAVDLKIRYEFRDGDNGEVLHTYGYGSGTDSGDKAVYKAQTGALKYALRNAFLVPDDADPEAEPEDREPPKQSRPPQAKVPAKPAAAKTTPEPPATAPAASQSAAKPAQVESQPPFEAPAPAEAPKQADVQADIAAVLSELPSKEQRDGYIEEAKKLTARVQKAGLTPAPGLTVGRKLTKYFTTVAGVKDLTQLTIAQWESLFSSITTALDAGDPNIITTIEEKIKS